MDSAGQDAKVMKMVKNIEGYYEPEESMPPYNCHLVGGPIDGMVLVMTDTPLDIIWKNQSTYRYSGRRKEDCEPFYTFQKKQ
jgi:hypothetical protein